MQNTLKIYNTLYMQSVATSLCPVNSLVSMAQSMQRTWVQFPGNTCTNKMYKMRSNIGYCKLLNPSQQKFNKVLETIHRDYGQCWQDPQLPLWGSPLLETGRHVHWTSLKWHMPCVFTKVSTKNTMQSETVLTGSNTQVGSAIQTMLSFY